MCNSWFLAWAKIEWSWPKSWFQVQINGVYSEPYQRMVNTVKFVLCRLAKLASNLSLNIKHWWIWLSFMMATHDRKSIWVENNGNSYCHWIKKHIVHRLIHIPFQEWIARKNLNIGVSIPGKWSFVHTKSAGFCEIQQISCEIRFSVPVRSCS